ncbi:hypothetical protein AM1_E0172 (plasmid) [Acaryochloris marina MBIC11017]|uniref:Uncharacterized protein n=1 Tax=Acaryochloris marina (strain MBIC 11017) TaxID=329726 RepID=A8ZMQ5_ACAM1|nr:hypothetical protein AM1_C0163 [Acaryochloris marina MBIC11017]ABW32941.1 hypothetical protein AM1_E0172 [Acaryochloris marina MBIC11017]
MGTISLIEAFIVIQEKTPLLGKNVVFFLLRRKLHEPFFD